MNYFVIISDILYPNTPVNFYRNLIYKVYNNVGLKRPAHFEEIPLWIPMIDSNEEESKLLIYKGVLDNSFIDLNTIKDNDIFYFSVWSFNEYYVTEIIRYIRTLKIIKPKIVCNNYTFKKAIINGMVDKINIDLNKPLNYRLFTGYNCIPRVYTQKGCFNHCKFCTDIDKGITNFSEIEMVKYLYDLDKLYFNLIRIGNPNLTNYYGIDFVNKITEKITKNKEIRNIIQISTNNPLNLKELRAYKVEIVEIGAESITDSVVNQYTNKTNVQELDDKIREIVDRKVKVALNIILGFPEETEESYNTLINFITNHRDFIMYYNFSHYCNYNIEGSSELTLNDYYTPEQREMHVKMINKVINAAINSLYNFIKYELHTRFNYDNWNR